MKVGQRLFLAVLPAILGVFTVAGLAYWGKYDRQAPQALIVIAIVAAVVSLGMAWYNTRYVARRVERLVARATKRKMPREDPTLLRSIASVMTAGVISYPRTTDELDSIESNVQDLQHALQQSREESDRRVNTAEVREAEYSSIVDEVARVMASRLEEAELPLHVLLSSPFGSLNENQEELLAATQSALDAADGEVRRLRTLLALDRGALVVTPQRVGLQELLRPALALAQARARSAHVTIHVEISDTAPRVIVDPLHVQAALTTLLSHAVMQTPADGEIRITADEGEPGRTRITVTHEAIRATPEELPLEMRLARRLIVLQHGTLPEKTGQTIIELPSETVMTTAHVMTHPQA